MQILFIFKPKSFFCEVIKYLEEFKENLREVQHVWLFLCNEMFLQKILFKACSEKKNTFLPFCKPVRGLRKIKL